MTNHQRKLLECFIGLEKFLNENNIWYSISFGTLLGAIRHKGFIPWDDDIDIIVDEQGIEKILLYKPEQVFSTNDNESCYVFLKWVDNKKSPYENPIFIDIFPIVPSTRKKAKQFYNSKNVLRYANDAINIAKLNTWIPCKNAIKFLLYPWRKVLKRISYKECIELTKEPNKPENLLILSEPFPNLLKKSLLPLNSKELIDVDFEGIKVKCHKNYDEVLKIFYGLNYMKPVKNNLYTHASVLGNAKAK